MRKNIGYFLLAAVILTGCSDSENEVKAEVEQSTALSQDLLEKYKKQINYGQETDLIKDFQNDIVYGFSGIEVNDELLAIYNEAIVNIIQSDLEKYVIIESYISDEHISEENLNLIEEEKEEYALDVITKLDDYISNFDENNNPTTKLEYIETTGFLADNQEVQALLAYSHLLQNPDDHAAYEALYDNVESPYRGIRWGEIEGFLSSNGVTVDDWKKIRAMNIEKNKPEYKATIGMTAEEVEKSSLGKPESINRTVTAYSVREQWVYENGMYLYFEDGILTSFQD
ncbi:hypothetical protein [Planomicrobium sp. Y74]|uniref:hypothetical protein n=1 Tax=Planomicrobium sp. Y74 TaxID=2478977 RepID=UPI000EF49046|nr:hypothetical protein [Planomicrobium sp. Y74]RLQ92109.1 hypothetical protein D9754_04815 [Planomicrobium sp. Y74]